MNTEALFLFLILLLGLVLCSFLGGNYNKENFSGKFSGTINLNDTGNSNQNSNYGTSNNHRNRYDNYNHYTGSSSNLSPGTTFYGKNGTTAVAMPNSDGSQSLQITLPGSSNVITFTSTDASSSNVESYTNYYGNNKTATTFYGPNGYTATIVNSNNEHQSIVVKTPNGTYYYDTSNSPDDTSTQYYGSTGSHIQQYPNSMAYQGPYGGQGGSVTGPEGNTAYYAQGPNGNTVAGTTNSNSNQYYGPNGGQAGSVTGPEGNTAYYAQGPNGNTAAGTTANGYGNQYYSTMPQGITANQIPPGQEDLYILKSQIVPPVCPACPVSSTVAREEKCPPCPACARCPEAPFECKKVPNYNAIDSQYLPSPVLNDFSTFGM